jgi:hypothetical protein
VTLVAGQRKSKVRVEVVLAGDLPSNPDHPLKFATPAQRREHLIRALIRGLQAVARHAPVDRAG